MTTEVRADFGMCEESAIGGPPFYCPCNKPAVALLKWRGRSDAPIRGCASCLDHNGKNRGGEVVRYVDDWAHNGEPE